MAGATYTPIQTITSSGASISFTSIPSTYTDLIIVVNGKSSGAGQMALRFNSATTNYSSTSLNGNGTTAYSQRTTTSSNSFMQLGYYDYYDSNQGTGIVNVMNYANTTTYKTVLARNNNASTGVGTSVGLWQSTSTINAIEVFPIGCTWITGTTLTLYGIAAA